MERIDELLAFIKTGGRPVVTFTDGVDQFDRKYAKSGMKAQILDAHVVEADVIELCFNYEPFLAHNQATEPSNPHGYKLGLGNEKIIFRPWEETKSYFSIASDASIDLFKEFEAARHTPAAAHLSYVAWLESTVLTQRESLAPLRLAEQKKADADRITADAANAAFEDLIDFHPDVLTAEARESIVAAAVADVWSRPGIALNYLTLKLAIQQEAKGRELNPRRETPTG